MKIVSYNCKNFKSNHLMIKKLIDQNQICFFVEHWLEENEAYLFNDICNNHSIIFKSDFDRMVNSRGRPFGGKFWVIDNKFKVKCH